MPWPSKPIEFQSLVQDYLKVSHFLDTWQRRVGVWDEQFSIIQLRVHNFVFSDRAMDFDLYQILSQSLTSSLLYLDPTIQTEADLKQLKHFLRDLTIENAGDTIGRFSAYLTSRLKKNKERWVVINAEESGPIISWFAYYLLGSDKIHIEYPSLLKSMKMLIDSELFVGLKLPSSNQDSIQISTAEDFYAFEAILDSLKSNYPELELNSWWPIVFAEWIEKYRYRLPSRQNPPQKFVGQLIRFQSRQEIPVTRDELSEQAIKHRVRASEQLRRAEMRGDELLAETIRVVVFETIGYGVESYVVSQRNPLIIEQSFHDWIFGDYWDDNEQCLDADTRKFLVSGEFVFHEFMQIPIEDWAPPAIQYCHALERELKRRLYEPSQSDYKNKKPWTLGTIPYLYKENNASKPKPDAKHDWQLVNRLVRASAVNKVEFNEFVERIIGEEIVIKRNELAHAEFISKDKAMSLRRAILGSDNEPGILVWLVRNLRVG